MFDILNTIKLGEKPQWLKEEDEFREAGRKRVSDEYGCDDYRKVHELFKVGEVYEFGEYVGVFNGRGPSNGCLMFSSGGEKDAMVNLVAPVDYGCIAYLLDKYNKTK